jgi:hypothetical protein
VKAPLRFVRDCGVYLARDGGTVLVAATVNHAGMSVERADGVESGSVSDVAGLGALVRKKLGECTLGPPADLSRYKKTDWPAYIASGLKTVRAFESRYVRLHVRGANDANITWEVMSPAFPSDAWLTSACSANATDRELGEWLLDFRALFVRLEVAARS